jgi:ABC-type branched-subunit amino acid transport system substrate-binding protein
MKAMFRSTTLFAICLLLAMSTFSCAPKPPVSGYPLDRQHVSRLLFEDAEKAFEEKKYDHALILYREYWTRFEDQPMASAALMRLGLIYEQLGEEAQAVRFFETLIDRFPDDPKATEASLALLEILHRQGRFVELIRRAEPLYHKTHDVKVYLWVADAFMALGAVENAVSALVLGDQVADDQEKPVIIAKVKHLLSNLSMVDLAALSRKLPDAFPKGYVLYYSGLSFMNGGDRQSAVEQFSSLVEKFPGHEFAAEAGQLLAMASGDTQSDKYRVGCLLPLSGSYQKFGEKALKGIELAVDRFHGFNRQNMVEIVVRDTGSVAEKAVRAVGELDAQSVLAIIGPIITAEAAAAESQNRQIPMIALTQKERIAERGDYIFRNFLTPKIQVKGLVKFAMDSLGLKRFSVFYPDEPYGKTFLNLFREEVMEAGGYISQVQSYPANVTDFSGPIQNLAGLFRADRQAQSRADSEAKAHDPVMGFEALFLPDGPSKAGMIIPQLAYFDIDDIYFLGTNLWHSETFVKTAGDIAQTFIIPDGFFEGSRNTAVRDFVKAYQDAFNETPGFMEAIAYDTAMILFETLSHYKIRSRNDIPELLRNLGDYPGVTGNTNFDSSGEAKKNVYILGVRNGQFQELERP